MMKARWVVPGIIAAGLAFADIAGAGAFPEFTISDIPNTGNFGYAVAVDGDVCAVSAPYASVSGANSGSVYVYRRDGASGWVLEKRLDDPGSVSGENFGYSIDLDGDMLIVGAPLEISGTTRPGAAFLYRRNQGGPGNWGLVRRVTAGAFAADGAAFGSAVAIRGDWAVVGAYHDNYLATQGGAAYLLYRNQNGPDGWEVVKRLRAAVSYNGARNGFSVDLSDRFAVVGAPAPGASGWAYVYERNTGGPNQWEYTTRIIPPQDIAGGQFGYAVAIDGEEIVVGQPMVTGSAGYFEGAAHVYRMRLYPDIWLHLREIHPHDPVADHNFGYSVALRNGTALVGARGDIALGNNAGAAYVFERDYGGADRWGESAKIVPSNGFPDNRYGASVSSDGMGFAVGASLYQVPGSPNRGAVFIYGNAVAVIDAQLAATAIDVPHDEGGRVLLTWNAVLMDIDLDIVPKYSVWRRLPDVGEVPAGRIARFSRAEGLWEWLADFPALRKPGYSYAAPTLYDSSSRTDGAHVFMVVAHGADPAELTEGTPATGYSVDNLAPLPPARLRVTRNGTGIELAWDAGGERDIGGYLVYRSAARMSDLAGLTPLGRTASTTFVDPAPSATEPFYAVCAEDVHDNRSAPSASVAIGPTAIASDARPPVFALDPAVPNPFNPTTTIRFSLARRGEARLTIYDVNGRLVRTLVAGSLAAGGHDVVWDGHDAAGRQVASGVYLYRLVAKDGMVVRRMTLLR